MHKIIRTNKVQYTTSVKYKSKYDSVSSVVVGPWCSFLLTAAAALCAALVWWVVYVRRSRRWRSRPPTAGSG
jgi:uncharacterized membrane protein YwaF